MSGVFRASAARPHKFDDEPSICRICLSECDSKEVYPLCECCEDEDLNMPDKEQETA